MFDMFSIINQRQITVLGSLNSLSLTRRQAKKKKKEKKDQKKGKVCVFSVFFALEAMFVGARKAFLRCCDWGDAGVFMGKIMTYESHNKAPNPLFSVAESHKESLREGSANRQCGFRLRGWARKSGDSALFTAACAHSLVLEHFGGSQSNMRRISDSSVAVSADGKRMPPHFLQNDF